jgi:hypothetical protein
MLSDLLKKNLEEVSRKRNPKRIIALTAIGAIPLGIGICRQFKDEMQRLEIFA